MGGCLVSEKDVVSCVIKENLCDNFSFFVYECGGIFLDDLQILFKEFGFSFLLSDGFDVVMVV